MKPTPFVCLLTLLPLLFPVASCSLHGQGSAPAALFQGDWLLDRSLGVTAPPNFTTRIEADRGELILRSRWDGSPGERSGLTLIGVTTDEFRIGTDGRERSTQVGPFVVKHSSSWENGALVTRWSTSEFMGSSFEGKWTRTVSKDGASLLLDIDATSSAGQNSRARLIFHRRTTAAPAGHGYRPPPPASNIA